ncbi:MAG: [Fe-Fe] hydrogenase large subunit C-terminal domain-containing protein [Acutalibacteraceae bacterium]|jgi:iron only hydrogenase large subunit-like protein/uncharacterized Fe-S cluster-containing protein
MNEAMHSQKSDCRNCYKCIRHCPVKSIRFVDNQAHIIHNECILCGQCYVVCPQGAKVIRPDLNRAKKLIADGAPVYASLAPSFIANYPGTSCATMEAALKRLGFAAAEETALGATIVKREYDRMVDEKQQEVVISSCCHSVNLLIQKHYPEALRYLAKIQSPMQAHCAEIKREHPGAKTVFIGPCISKKDEGDLYPGIVDCVLTFEELSQWFAEENIVPEQDADGNRQSRARLFPTAGGILRTMKCGSADVSYLAVDGTENCIHTLEDLLSGKIKNCFIEMSACAGSCIGGPITAKRGLSPVRSFMAVDRFAGKEDFPVPEVAPELLQKHMTSLEVRREMPGSAAIAEILRKMGKTSPEQELNCGSCGYNTCREKAIAVFNGKADLTMCLPFLKEKAESFSDNIIKNTPNGILVLNEQLEVQQINRAACKIMNIKNAGDILGDQVVRVLDPTVFFDVLQSGRAVRDRRVYLAEYQKYVELTVIYDKSYHIVMGFMRDVTDEEGERAKKETLSRQTIEITDKVIEKQMRVVQEIASLLGETTAETKIALTNLKESLNDE